MQLAAAPPTRWAPFAGPETTIQEMRRAVMSDRGARSMALRRLVERIVLGLQPKDYLSEILAIRHFAAAHVRYLNDPTTVELVKDPERLVEELVVTGGGDPLRGTATGDCDDIATLLAAMAFCLGRQAEFVTVGFGAPGQYSHVFTRVLEPKSRRWVLVDPVAGTDEERMARRVTTFRTWPIDT